jgi:phosphoenolpyruvate synthase/pyruvate phosphate dikinase
MNQYVLYFSETDKSSIGLVGGKGANLGELCHITGINVPTGFCITTQAYTDFVNRSEEVSRLLDALQAIDAESLEAIKTVGQRIRAYLESMDIPSLIRQEISQAWQKTGSQHAYAVRSSATAEDLPGASFAGQQDTYLNIKGESELLFHVRKCWASLFTDRAIVYRARNGFDHGKVLLSVVVQQMVFPEVSGIMFTADPVTGNRKVISIDAAFGLGEALVSGLVNADLYKIRGERIVKKQVAVKKLAIYPLADGGTEEREISLQRQSEQVLADGAILELVRVGRRIEQHFGQPQDIEWGYAEGKIYILQSRPITTLYPLPELPDATPGVYVSFGHVQMMTDPIKPLGMSIWEKTMATIDSQYSMVPAGGRLYFDITNTLASWLSRKTAPALYSKSDALLSNAIAEVIRRRDFIATLKPRKRATVEKSYMRKSMGTMAGGMYAMLFRERLEVPDVTVIRGRIISELQSALSRRSGREKLDLLANHFGKVFMAFMDVIGKPVFAAWLASLLIGWLARRWLGESSVLDELTKSAPGNVSTEMGLELGDLADVIRPYPAALEYMKGADDATFLDGLERVEGGTAIRPAFTAFLAKYGMRCPGEIDVTRPRWRERPTQLVPSIISHIQSIEPGEHRLRFAQGRVEAEQAAQMLLLRLKQKLGGNFKARLMGKFVRTYREFIGLREYPKYLMVSLLDEYKRAIMEEAARLVEQGIVDQAEDVFYLTLEELTAAVATGRADRDKIAALKEKYAEYEKLKPPRVLTSEGEAIFGSYAPRDLPEGALAGTPVSSGIVEGRARVVTKLEETDLEKGDILVALFTDPGWTPLFVSASGLVTEIGGLMTHGAVVAREYGIPAVVGVENATKLIKDGQRIRVNGAEGYVEIL